MRNLSFKILIFCMFLPPAMYLATVQTLERSFEKRYQSEIEALYLGDSKPLLDGIVTINNAVRKNIESYLNNRSNFFCDLKVDVQVITNGGEIIYPGIGEDNNEPVFETDFYKVASENYRVLNDGLNVFVSVLLDRNTFLSGFIFMVYFLISLFLLYCFYYISKQKASLEAQKKSNEINRLRELEIKNTQRLSDLSNDREKLNNSLAIMRDKVSENSRNEDGMLEEIIRLEGEVEENLLLQAIQQKEISKLNEQIKKLKFVKKKSGKYKVKRVESTLRRFKTLYKNIKIHDRAADGYFCLDEDLKLKCEELIYKLNESPDKVSVKRKVFGKKGRETVLEVLFSYKGRLYFRNIDGGKVEILAIGTKNTQAKELEFLDNL